jgi:transposase
VDPTGRASDGNPGRALRSLGGADRRSNQHYDHEPRYPAAGVDPKKRTVGAAERNEKHRAIWHRIVTKLDARRYVFIDESGANITLVPRYGRAPKGERCPGIVPRNYGENLTLFASLTTEGVRAAMLLDGGADHTAFQLYVERILVPTLKPKQVVVLDNLSVHKHRAVRDAIHAAGCHILFLPSYSPDFNPIELAFSQIKAYLRRKAARTREALEEEIGRAIDIVSPQDAAAYFRHCGYMPL